MVVERLHIIFCIVRVWLASARGSRLGSLAPVPPDHSINTSPVVRPAQVGSAAHHGEASSAQCAGLRVGPSDRVRVDRCL